MKPILLLSSVLITMVGCKRERERIPTPEQVTHIAKPDPWDGKAIVPAAPRTATLDCDKVVPEALRSEFLSNATVTSVTNRPTATAVCRLEGPAMSIGSSVQAKCDTTASAVEDFKRANPTAKDVALGEAAALAESGELQELAAWDPKSGCHIDVTVPKSVDAVAFGRAILENMPPRG